MVVVVVVEVLVDVVVTAHTTILTITPPITWNTVFSD
jgi:hypothetical protein